MKMSRLVYLMPLCLLIVVACSKPEEVPNIDREGCLDDPGSGITSQILSGPTTNVQGKVSVFFKLEDENQRGVAGLEEADFLFFEKGQFDDCHHLISEDEAARQIVPSPQEFQYNISLVLDLSGSVLNNSLDQLKEAANTFVSTAISGPASDRLQMEIWWFDGKETLHPLVALTNDTLALMDAITNISSTISTDNSTDLNNAVINGLAATEATLTNLPDGVISGASMVVFTDGRDRAQRRSFSDVEEALNNASAGITLFTIGLGSEIEVERLEAIGRNGSTFANNAEDLVSSFENIGGQVTNEAQSYYRFEYCSPVRSDSASLIIKAVKGSQAGCVQFEYDASNFDGSCSL